MTADTSLAFEHLHELLRQMADAEQMLAHGPKRIAAVDKKIKVAMQACDAQKEHIKQLRKATDEATLNLKSREAVVAKHSLRLNEASSNKEYDIINGQKQTEQAACAELEDQILEMLEGVDVASTELKRLEQELADLQQKSAKIVADVQAKQPGLDADVERLNKEIAEAESVIPGGEPRTTYERLKLVQGASAMAKVEDTYCLECNTGATPQDIVRLNLGEFLLCRACGRILYLTDFQSG